MAAHVSQQLSVRQSERQRVDGLVRHIHRYRREVVINYYVALKSKRFVILTGSQDVDKMSLAQGVARGLVGPSALQWSCFEAHPWWSTNTGLPSHFASVHARFAEARMSDLLEFASEGARKELAFFVGIKRMSRAEIECYFHDLPRGFLWRADASTARVHLPNNLFVTGTFDVDRESSLALSQDVFSRHAAIVHIGHDDLAVPDERSHVAWTRADWQQQFIRSRVCHSDQARVKLARILPDYLNPLAPLDGLRRRFGPIDLLPFVIEDAWLYLANAFDNDAQGLFVKSIAENLAIAQDYVLLQNVLPRILPRIDVKARVWNDVLEYLALCHPRAYAWMQHLLSPANGGSANRLNAPGPQIDEVSHANIVLKPL